MGFKFNPFTSNFDQVSNVAKFIFETAISGTAPTNGQVLQYNSTSGEWEPTTFAGGGGDVTGPGASTDNAIVRFDGASGKIIQDYTSNAPTITDNGIPSFSTDDYPTSERIGALSSVTGIRAVAVGNSSEASQNGTAVGYDSIAANFSIAIGQTAQANNSNSFAVGHAAMADADFGTAMGPSAVVDTGHNLSIALGGFNAITTADRQMVIGGSFGPINQYWFGSTDGRNAAGTFTRDFTFNFPAPSGTDVNAPRDFILKGPSGTGLGEGGRLKFQVAPPTVTGSTSNPHESALELTQDKRVIQSTPNSEIGDSDVLNRSGSFYLDEANDNLNVKVKYSDNSIKYGTISLSDNQSDLWRSIKNEVVTSLTFDSIALADFSGAIYEFSFFNTVQAVSRKLRVTVNNTGSVVSHSISGKFGSNVKVSVDAVVNGSQMELNLVNNETFTVSVNAARLLL